MKHLFSKFKTLFSAIVLAAIAYMSLFLGVAAAADASSGMSTNGNTTITTSTGTSTVDGDIDNLGEVVGTDTKTNTSMSTMRQNLPDAQNISGLHQIDMQDAYNWAYKNGITTMSYSNARLNSPILRYEFAIMMTRFIENVEGKSIMRNETDRCKINKYWDHDRMGNSIRPYVQKMCDAGLMGWKYDVTTNNKVITTMLGNFRPFDAMLEGEIYIVTHRYNETNIRLIPTSNTRGDAIRFLYSISPVVDVK